MLYHLRVASQSKIIFYALVKDINLFYSNFFTLSISLLSNKSAARSWNISIKFLPVLALVSKNLIALFSANFIFLN